MEKAPRWRKSIFARQIAAQRANKESAQSLNGSGTKDQSCGATNLASLPLESMDIEPSKSLVIGNSSKNIIFLLIVN